MKLEVASSIGRRGKMMMMKNKKNKKNNETI